MSNPIQPKPILVEMDRPRYLMFDLNAMAALEDEYGDSRAAFQAVEDGSMKAVRFVLWAGLQRDAQERSEDLTLEQAGALATFGGLKQLAPILVGALAEASPEEVASMTEANPKGAQSKTAKAKAAKA